MVKSDLEILQAHLPSHSQAIVLYWSPCSFELVDLVQTAVACFADADIVVAAVRGSGSR